MIQSAVDRGREHSTTRGEKTENMPQEDVVLDLRRHLENFRLTHPYRKIQIEGRNMTSTGEFISAIREFLDEGWPL